ncbi:MAG: hypothetical protein M5U16_00755 [Hyphomicrobium sp.]|nr:hypothetical protein [Hyphomicrobium sp.]
MCTRRRSHPRAGKALLASTPGLAVDVATGLDEGALCQRIGDYDALIVRSKTRVTAPVIAAGKKLRVIGRAGIGVDNIDVAAATEHGIVVFNTPDANATTTAELALAHLLSLSRHLPQADRSVRRGEWKPGISSAPSWPRRPWASLASAPSGASWRGAAWHSACACSPSIPLSCRT